MAKKTQKTHSALKKIAKVKSNGTVKITKAGRNHNTGKHKRKTIRHRSDEALMSQGDYKRLRNLLQK